MSKKHHGSRLDDFLKDEGVFEDMQELAIKEVVVWQLTEAMQQRSLTESQWPPCSRPTVPRSTD